MNSTKSKASSRDPEQAFRKRFYSLLGKPSKGSYQYQDAEGKWSYSKRHNAKSSDVYAHLRGTKTWALSSVKRFDGIVGEQALFLVMDIDERFQDRIGIVRRVLANKNLADAAFGTTGSDVGRGKVVVTLASPIPQRLAIEITASIHTECMAHLLWGPETNATSLFPTGGAGGIVRIGGRNRSRTGNNHLDLITDLQGRVSNLDHIVPALIPIPPSYTVYVDGIRVGDGVACCNGLQLRANELRTLPYLGNGATIFKDMASLAKDAIRKHGKGDEGKAYFEKGCSLLEALIPPDKSKTLKQIRKPTTRERVWNSNCDFMKDGAGKGYWKGEDRLGDWKALPISDMHFEQFIAPGKAAWKAYAAIAAFVTKYRHDPHAFPMAYGQLARLSGYEDSSSARHAVDEAERAGLLFRLDRGVPKTGTKLVTMFSLVGIGETPQVAYDLGVASEAYRERLEKRREQNLPVQQQRIENGRLVTSPRLPARINPKPTIQYPAIAA